MMHSAIIFLTLVVLLSPQPAAQQKKTRDQKVREDQQKVTQDGFWIYNDLPQAFQKAHNTGKPLLVVLRCLPCEECVKLDEELVDTDPVLRPLLEQFVCVRVVSTNGLDLALFQFDTDQSFAVFMLNADRTIYGRFGTRSHRTEWVGDVSLSGLADALRGTLDLHQDYPNNKAALAAKTGPPPLFERPELFPSLKGKYTSSLNYSGDVVKSCIHCHQIGDAVRDHYRERNEPLPEEILSPYPHPRSLGLILDPRFRATVKEITANSIAEKSGLMPGDQIQTLNGQPILSMADVQWVLHQFSATGGEVQMSLKRSDKTRELTMLLPDLWRSLDDISWRASTWGLRRMATGGLQLEALSPAEKMAHNIASDSMALRVKHVGQYGPHAAAKNAGFQTNDILVSYDSQTSLLTDSDVLRYGMTVRKSGDVVPVEILRGSERRSLQLPMQK